MPFLSWRLCTFLQLAYEQCSFGLSLCSIISASVFLITTNQLVVSPRHAFLAWSPRHLGVWSSRFCSGVPQDQSCCESASESCHTKSSESFLRWAHSNLVPCISVVGRTCKCTAFSPDRKMPAMTGTIRSYCEKQIIWQPPPNSNGDLQPSMSYRSGTRTSRISFHRFPANLARLGFPCKKYSSH